MSMRGENSCPGCGEGSYIIGEKTHNSHYGRYCSKNLLKEKHNKKRSDWTTNFETEKKTKTMTITMQKMILLMSAFTLMLSEISFLGVMHFKPKTAHHQMS